jgi:hypothetical protein
MALTVEDIASSLSVLRFACAPQMPFPSFWFVGALYVAWVSFTRVYFLLEPFFFPGGWADKTPLGLA